MTIREGINSAAQWAFLLAVYVVLYVSAATIAITDPTKDDHDDI